MIIHTLCDSCNMGTSDLPDIHMACSAQGRVRIYHANHEYVRYNFYVTRPLVISFEVCVT